MAKQPEARWPSAGAFAEAIENALSPRGVRTRVMAATPPRPKTRAAASGSTTVASSARPSATRVAAASFGRPAAAAGAEPQRSRGRRFAVAALAAAVLGVVLVALATALPGGSSKPRTTAQVKRPAPVHSTPTTAARPASTKPQPPKPKPKPVTQAQTTASTTPQVTGTAAAAHPPTAGADALEADGHALLNAGNYQAAIPILQQAVTSAPKGSLTYAYALYDLGRALRLAGDPQAAVKVLYQRLQIPNQTGTVRSELQSALLEMGKKAGKHGRGPDGHGPPGHGGD
jgi:serine/threonine-protein kinase